MKICFFYSNLVNASESILESIIHETQWKWIKVLHEMNIETIIVSAATESIRKVLQGVKCYFVKSKKSVHKFHYDSSFIASSAKIIREEQVNIIHAHSLDEIKCHALLKKKLPSEIPITVQDHGSTPKFWHRALKQFFNEANTIVFNNQGLEEQWISKGLVQSSQVKFALEDYPYFDESKTDFNLQLDGSPIFLWVGHLNENKDPLTIVDAFGKIQGQLINARLYMVYREGELETELKTFIQENNLEKSVSLVGSVPHDQLRAYFMASDYFILGSAKEGSGYAAMEAISCGLIPILSDIPSFRHFTKNGELGVLFERGNANDLVRSFFEMIKKDQDEMKERLQRYFEENLSKVAFTNQVRDLYKLDG